MAIECEAKIQVDNLDVIRTRLEKLGGVNEGEVFERNWVLDYPQGNLQQDGVLLRVRNTGGVDGIVTVKRKTIGGEFKSREEVECMVDSTEDVLQQMEIIGFQVKWIYEKYRGTWLWHDCILALDECPEIGCFVEIEGDPKRIREAALSLELSPDDHIDASYLALWQEYLQSNSEKPRHMIFMPDYQVRRKSGFTGIRYHPRSDSDAADI